VIPQFGAQPGLFAWLVEFLLPKWLLDLGSWLALEAFGCQEGGLQDWHSNFGQRELWIA